MAGVPALKALARSLVAAVLVEELVECAPLDPQIKLQHLLGHLLIGLLQYVNQTPSQELLSALSSEEAVSDSVLASSASPANPVYVVFYCHGEAVVDDVFHVRDVQASRRHVCGDKDVDPASFELPEGFLSLPLGLVAVYRPDLVALVPQTVLQVVSLHLLQNEYDHSVLRFFVGVFL